MRAAYDMAGDYEGLKAMSQRVSGAFTLAQLDKAIETLEQTRALYEEMGDREVLATYSFISVVYMRNL